MCVEKQSQSGDIRVKIRQSDKDCREMSKLLTKMLPSLVTESVNRRPRKGWMVMLASAWVLVSCATTPMESSSESSGRQEAQGAASSAQQSEAGRLAEVEARQHERWQRVLQSEVERLAREQARAEQEAVQAEQEAAQAEQEAEQARREAEARRRRQQAEAEQAARIAEQEARIAELESEIAAYDARIAEQEQVNARLEDAVLAAEDLLQALTLEQQKYDNVDVNGEPVDSLDKSSLRELEARAERLINATQ